MSARPNMTPTPTPKADDLPFGAGHTHDLIPLEWTTRSLRGRNAATDASQVPHPSSVARGRQHPVQSMGQTIGQ
jgi:hypothetical protein